MTDADNTCSWLRPDYRRMVLALVSFYQRGELVAAGELIESLDRYDVDRVLLAAIHMTGAHMDPDKLRARILDLAAQPDNDER